MVKIVAKDHKPMVGIFRKDNDELHCVVDWSLDPNDDSVLEFDSSIYYKVTGNTYEEVTSGRKDTKPKRGRWIDDMEREAEGL